MAAPAPGEGGPQPMEVVAAAPAGGAAPTAPAAGKPSAIPTAELAPGLTISRVVKVSEQQQRQGELEKSDWPGLG